MANLNFNANLNSLFKNFKQQLQYDEKAFDVNGDGKIDSKDEKALTTERKNLLKNENLFDVNGDGKFDQNDIDMFVKYDYDANGKTTKTEKAFIEEYKTTMKKAFLEKGVTFELDGVMYADGAKANSTINGIRYENGKKVNKTIDGKLYVDGKLKTGVHCDGLYYKNGKVYSGTVKEGNTTTEYKKGVMQYSVTDNCEASYPKIKGGEENLKKGVIQYKGLLSSGGNKQAINFKLEIGDKVEFDKAGNVKITHKDGTKIALGKDGIVYASSSKTFTGDMGGKHYENGKLADGVFNYKRYEKGIFKENIDKTKETIKKDGQYTTTTKTYFSPENKTVSKSIITTDKDGKVTSKTYEYYNSQGKLMCRETLDKRFSECTVTKKEVYDEDGHLIGKRDYSTSNIGVRKKEYIYDESGKQISFKESSRSHGILDSAYTSNYDSSLSSKVFKNIEWEMSSDRYFTNFNHESSYFSGLNQMPFHYF